MARTERFEGCTVEFRVPDFRAGVDFYSRLFGRPPDFAPHRDFVEWEGFDGFWFQLGEGEPRPTYALRLRVRDIEAECRRVEQELGVRCSPLTRLPGLVAFCNVDDPWGNTLGFYQRLFEDGPAVPGGSFHDFEG
jgi:predicted enzyme related to lactoylglutathione lyase